MPISEMKQDEPMAAFWPLIKLLAKISGKDLILFQHVQFTLYIKVNLIIGKTTCHLVIRVIICIHSFFFFNLTSAFVPRV